MCNAHEGTNGLAALSSELLALAALSSELLAFTHIPIQTTFSLLFLQNVSLETKKIQAITYAQSSQHLNILNSSKYN